MRIFRAAKVRMAKADIRFCMRVRLRSRDLRLMVKGPYTEEERRHILERAKELQKSRYSKVNIVPDLTKNQRSEETTMREQRPVKRRARKKLEIVGGGKKRRRIIK